MVFSISVPLTIQFFPIKNFTFTVASLCSKAEAAGTIQKRKCKRLDGSDPETSGNGASNPAAIRIGFHFALSSFSC
jgi:hypothetical protein